MKFIRSALLPTETLIYSSHPHWIIFTPGIFFVAIALFILFFGPVYLFLDPSFTLLSLTLPQMLAGLCAFVGAYWLFGALITYFSAEYGVTNKRVLMKAGLIRRDTSEIFLDKLEAINVDQSILGRILDYGSLCIIGTGGTRDVYYNVPKPFLFRQAAQQQVDREIHR